jgi:hypothetical protein
VSQLANDLYAFIQTNHKKIPTDMYRRIRRRLDLPSSLPDHQFDKEESLFLIDMLLNKKTDHHYELAQYVLKVYYKGDITQPK